MGSSPLSRPRPSWGKTYANSVKPFNFLISPIVKSIDHPPGTAGSKFHLIAPYSRNPLEWVRFSYSDIHSPEGKYRIRTSGTSNRAAIRVQTFADFLDHFRIHPEAKSAGPDKRPSDSWTSGLLGRLDVQILTVLHIGKESNLLEDQEKVRSEMEGSPIRRAPSRLTQRCSYAF